MHAKNTIFVEMCTEKQLYKQQLCAKPLLCKNVHTNNMISVEMCTENKPINQQIYSQTMNNRYPRLVADLKKLRENIDTAIRECGNFGIQVAGVVKGIHAVKAFMPAYIESDLTELASSRLEQLERLRELGWNKTLTLVRIPMISEVNEVVRIADMSLNSEMSVLRALNDASLRARDTAQSAVQQTSDTVQSTAQQASDTVQSAVQQTSDTVQSAVQQTSDTVQSTALRARDTVQSAATQTGDTAQQTNKPWAQHRVILMADLGDLREGFWNKDDLIETAAAVEFEMPGLYLAGIGTNLGCYGALVPTAEKIAELLPIADAVEARIGRKLDIISGGASTSYPRITDADMPKGINHLRLGENILLARDNELFHGHSTAPMHQDVFTLQAEVIEVKTKPSYPQGVINVDAFGRKPHYEDRGIRTRALVAVGRVDVGSFDDLRPRMSGVEILGGSSDHMILDVEEVMAAAFDEQGDVPSPVPIKPGDILEFDVSYGSLVFLTGSENLHFEGRNH